MRREIVISFFAAALAAGCETVDTTKSGEVGVERHQRMLVSSEEINQASDKAYHDLLQQAQAKGALNRDPAQLERVKRIQDRIIPQTGAFRADAPKWKWEVNVISTKDVNAFSMPGGKTAVFSGLIEQLKPSDDELAAVMGHEIGHALREHARERASEAAAQQVGLGVVGAVLGVPSGYLDLSSVLLNVMFTLPHSRTQETEADRIGVELAARAGYDPHAAISLWEKMQKLGGGKQSPQFLSTHPSNEARIADLRNYAERVMPLYQQAKARGSAAAGR
jgi:predicted Zn-dependent protease